MEATNETRVLSAALAEPGLWLAQAHRITPDLFIANRNLAVQLCAMTEAGKATEPAAVKTWLDEKGVAVPLSDLMAIAEHAPASPAGMEAAVDALVNDAKRHAIRRVSNLLTQLAADPRQRPDDIITEAVRKLTDIGARSTQAVKPLGPELVRVVKELGKPLKHGVKTGIRPLDSFTGGLTPGQLVVLGARPSMGKTSLALGVARQAALDGKTVCFLSLEMSTDQVIHRLLADVANVDLATISTHRLSDQEMTSVMAAANRLYESRVFIGESATNATQVCAQLKHQHGLDLVVVDYLQLMQVKAESREQQIATLSRDLKQLARRVGVPVLVLSQLNRAIEARSCKRPQLSDLRESGAIEQDADIVLLLWREAYYDDEADPSVAELVIAKQRNGPVGTLPLHWDETRARFSQAKSP